MSWTQPRDLVEQVLRLWERGTLLAALADGKLPFPMRLKLRRPDSVDFTERFDEVRAWVAKFCTAQHCRIEMRQMHHRVRGSNAIPDQVWVDSLDDALALIGRKREAAEFVELLAETQRRLPQLLEWVRRRPMQALALAEDWSRLLDVVAWVRDRPRPGVYLRQVDIPGVQSKFIENHRGILAELFDLVLPASLIDADARGVLGFNRRYGFADKPRPVRFRLLDPAHSLLPGVTGGDITLDSESFRTLRCDVERVFITENETNFLAFPPFAHSLVLFGAGYGFEALRHNNWLEQLQLYYWGDIDTHGFAIVDQLRGYLPQVQTFLMDRDTLMAFEPWWGTEDRQISHDLLRLEPAERALYDDLRDQRIRANLRLEQEFIGFDWVRAKLASLD